MILIRPKPPRWRREMNTAMVGIHTRPPPTETEDGHTGDLNINQIAPAETEIEHRDDGDSGTDGHSVCLRCRSVRWKKLASEGKPGQVVLNVSESREQLQRSNCPLCHLLSTIKPQTDEQGTKELRLFSTRNALALHSPLRRGIDGYVDGRCLSFSESQDMLAWNDGFLALSDPSIVPVYDIRQLNPHRIDVDFIQQCLKQCVKHGPRCIVPEGPPPSKLRVIDCESPQREVVPAPTNCPYAALSYVWGPAQSSAVCDEDSDMYPRVVMDAIKATTLLEMKYLWVDRYCIKQEDKKQQILQMGRIYSHAQITLVAASGCDARYGLPGLGSIDRPGRDRQTLCGAIFQQGARHVSHFVKDSAWVTRGWTFQESILSRRRVLFTSSEMSFLCNSMHCAESWKAPLKEIEHMSTNPFQGLTLQQFSNFGRYTHKIRADLITACLKQYMERKLTYPSDALDACTGVLKRLETDKELFTCGILTAQIDSSDEQSIRPPGSDDLPLSKTYNVRASLEGNRYLLWITWYHTIPSSRRASLPSWSFLGWDGPAAMDVSEIEPACFRPLTDQDNDNNNDYMPSLAVEPPMSRSSSPERLRIRGFLFKMQLLYLTPQSMQSGYYARLQLDHDHSEIRLASMDTSNTTPGEYSGLILTNSLNYKLDANSRTHSSILILTQSHENEFERIGIVHSTQSERFWLDSQETCLRSFPRLRWLDNEPHRYLYIQEARRETFILA
ncbi:hypothetical protein PG984_007088 [Apiospora sp. TS-2023a]